MNFPHGSLPGGIQIIETRGVALSQFLVPKSRHDHSFDADDSNCLRLYPSVGGVRCVLKCLVERRLNKALFPQSFRRKVFAGDHGIDSDTKAGRKLQESHQPPIESHQPPIMGERYGAEGAAGSAYIIWQRLHHLAPPLLGRVRLLRAGES